MTARMPFALFFCAYLAMVALASHPAAALEAGQAPQTKAGIAIGIAAVPLPPGLYMVDHLFYYRFRLAGPGVVAPSAPRGWAVDADPGLLWYPGWTFLGAAYSAFVAVPFVAASIDSAPASGFAGMSLRGMHNTFISPIRLQWNVGNGFFVQAAGSVYVPDGTITGPLGNSNTGSDYFTFQPDLVLSYVKDGWNLTSYMYLEHNTKNRRSDYTTGDIFHADLTATRQFGKWTIGPVAYYIVQTSSDRPGLRTDAFFSAAAAVPGGIHGFNAGKFEQFAAGGLVGYDFGFAHLTVFATQEIFARAFGGSSGTPFLNVIPFASETTARGWTVFSRLSFQLWAPQAPPVGTTPAALRPGAAGQD